MLACCEQSATEPSASIITSSLASAFPEACLASSLAGAISVARVFASASSSGVPHMLVVGALAAVVPHMLVVGDVPQKSDVGVGAFTFFCCASA